MDKLDYISVTSFCKSKDTIKRMKIKATKWQLGKSNQEKPQGDSTTHQLAKTRNSDKAKYQQGCAA